MSRVVQRNLSDRLIANPAVLVAAGLGTVEEHTAAVVTRMRQVEQEMLLQFPVPMLHVDTTGPYNPSIDTILDFATASGSS